MPHGRTATLPGAVIHIILFLPTGSGLQFNTRRSPGAGEIERGQKMNTFGRRFSTATCLSFVVLQFLLYACKAEAGG